MTATFSNNSLANEIADSVDDPDAIRDLWDLISEWNTADRDHDACPSGSGYPHAKERELYEAILQVAIKWVAQSGYSVK